MVYYECQRCGYNTTLKGNIKHHLNRKNVCEPILDNISIEQMKEIYNLNNTPKIHLNNTNNTQLTQKLNEITPKCSLMLGFSSEPTWQGNWTTPVNRTFKQAR